MGLFKFLSEAMAAAAEEDQKRKEEEQQRKAELKEKWQQEICDLEKMRDIAISKGDIEAKHEIDLNISLVKAKISGDDHAQLCIQQEIMALHGNSPKFNGVSVKYYDMNDNN